MKTLNVTESFFVIQVSFPVHLRGMDCEVEVEITYLHSDKFVCHLTGFSNCSIDGKKIDDSKVVEANKMFGFDFYVDIDDLIQAKLTKPFVRGLVKSKLSALIADL